MIHHPLISNFIPAIEILENNSFEQLCINYINERLQYQFNELVFLNEQELYVKESINWTTISYKDNQKIIEVIAKKPFGLLNILEEYCMMNRVADDMALLKLFNQAHDVPVKGEKLNNFGEWANPSGVRYVHSQLNSDSKGFFFASDSDTISDEVHKHFIDFTQSGCILR